MRLHPHRRLMPPELYQKTRHSQLPPRARKRHSRRELAQPCGADYLVSRKIQDVIKEVISHTPACLRTALTRWDTRDNYFLNPRLLRPDFSDRVKRGSADFVCRSHADTVSAHQPTRSRTLRSDHVHTCTNKYGIREHVPSLVPAPCSLRIVFSSGLLANYEYRGSAYIVPVLVRVCKLIYRRSAACSEAPAVA